MQLLHKNQCLSHMFQFPEFPAETSLLPALLRMKVWMLIIIHNRYLDKLVERHYKCIWHSHLSLSLIDNLDCKDLPRNEYFYAQATSPSIIMWRQRISLNTLQITLSTIAYMSAQTRPPWTRCGRLRWTWRWCRSVTTPSPRTAPSASGRGCWRAAAGGGGSYHPSSAGD